MRKIFVNSLALAFRRKIQAPLPSLVTKAAIAFLAYPILRQGMSNLNLSDHYDLVFEDNFQEGEMREFQVGPQKEDAVLVCKVKGRIYCVSNSCSHSGAPLSAGFLIGDKVKCPWHNAAFSVVTGAFEEGPMLNGLQTFPVTQEGNTVSIKIDKNLLNKKRQLKMVKRGNDPNHVVIVGGGIAGQSAAETLRQAGFEGKITMITNEEYLPYDRTPMSKFMFQFSPAFIMPRNKQFYDEYGIEIRTSTNVEHVDVENQLLHLNNEKLHYDKLLIATGGRAQRPNVDGANLQNIHTLRSIDDAQKIREAARKARNIVIVGASFIGMETASALKKELKDQVHITVVSPSGTPYERTLGSEVGKALQNLNEQNGIHFELKAGVKRFSGDGAVQSVELSTGKSLQADLVVLGTGIRPNNEIAKNSHLTISPQNGGIVADVFLKAAKNVWVAGDVASYPYWVNGEHVRVEHQNEAIRQGYVAAINMVGRPMPNLDIPFFWTRLWDRTLSYSGYAVGYDEVIIDGSLKDLKFVAYYAKQDKIVASASMNVGNAQMIISEAMKLNLLPKASELKERKTTLEEIKQRVQQFGPACSCKREGMCGQKL